MKDITVIVPTFKRPNLFLQAIKYWGESNLETIIVDSGYNNFSDIVLPDNIKIISVKENSLIRIKHVIDLINSKYVVLCAEDDFILINSLFDCISFLDNNSDYNSCTGNFYSFRNKNGIFVDKLYKKNFDKILIQDIKSRFENSLSPFNLVLYSVQRSNSFKKILNSWDEVGNANAFELYLSLAASIFGNHKTLNIPYSFREINLKSWGRKEEDFYSWWLNERNIAYKDIFVTNLYNLFTENIKISFLEFNLLLNVTLSKYFQIYYLNNQNIILKFIKLFIPDTLLSKVNFIIKRGLKISIKGQPKSLKSIFSKVEFNSNLENDIYKVFNYIEKNYKLNGM